MTPDKLNGFIEIDHTADISLRIWAPTLEDLFKLAVEGMNSIIGIDLNNNDPGEFQDFCIEDVDLESMLISLMNEVNYKIQQELVSAVITDILIENKKVTGKMFLKEIKTIQKEIKAVTYHNLKINHSKKGYSVVVVFDV